MKKRFFISGFIAMAVFVIFNIQPLMATDYSEELNPEILIESASFSEKSLNFTQSLEFFDGQFKLLVPANTLQSSVKVVAKKNTAPFDWPWNYKPLTVVYEFDLIDWGQSYNRQRPLKVEISYEEKNGYYKKIFFLDGNSGRWRPLPSVDDPLKQKVEANIHLPFARLAVLYIPEVPTLGQASWYRFRNGLFAASPDFPRGSIIRVRNLSNGKFVDVTINDYGPDRSIHPDRVIDLDLVAFNKIASARDGLIEVSLEALHLALPGNDHIFTAGPPWPELNSRSAIIIAEDSGRILFNKEAEQVASLASLTKLLAVRVFLDTGQDLNRLVSYSVKDEEYNHQYVRPWESARLNLREGDVLRVEDLLYAAVISSANNAMETLLRASGLSRDEFIARMNIYAETWGARNTKFVEPTGLSRDNVSSPLDYAIITRELFKHPLLAKISNTRNYSFSLSNRPQSYRLNHTSLLIRNGSWSLSGSKTGFINASGHCLMNRLATPQGNLIIVSFGASSREASHNDNEQLIRYGLKIF